MAAISLDKRIILVIFLAIGVGVLAFEPQITTIAGGYGPIATVVVGVLFFALREVIKEYGEQNGDLNQTQQIEDLKLEIAELKKQIIPTADTAQTSEEDSQISA